MRSLPREGSKAICLREPRLKRAGSARSQSCTLRGPSGLHLRPVPSHNWSQQQTPLFSPCCFCCCWSNTGLDPRIILAPWSWSQSWSSSHSWSWSQTWSSSHSWSWPVCLPDLVKFFRLFGLLVVVVEGEVTWDGDHHCVVQPGSGQDPSGSLHLWKPNYSSTLVSRNNKQLWQVFKIIHFLTK